MSWPLPIREFANLPNHSGAVGISWPDSSAWSRVVQAEADDLLGVGHRREKAQLGERDALLCALRALAEVGERVCVQCPEQALYRARRCVERRDGYDVLVDQDAGLRAVAVVECE